MSADASPLRVAPARFLVSLLLGYIVASQLNWLVAEQWLNPIIEPGLAGMMRSAEGINLPGLIAGFFLPVLVTAVLLALLPWPAHWVARGLLAGGLVSLSTFYGAYAFLAGWTRLPMREMMLTATADSLTILLGGLIIAFVQQFRVNPRH